MVRNNFCNFSSFQKGYDNQKPFQATLSALLHKGTNHQNTYDVSTLTLNSTVQAEYKQKILFIKRYFKQLERTAGGI